MEDDDREFIPTLTGPQQQRPNTKAWKCFQRLIQHLCDDKLQLYSPLGDWLHTHSAGGIWGSYCADDKDTIHILQEYEPDIPAAWHCYSMYGCIYQTHCEVKDWRPTPDFTPCTIYTMANGDISLQQVLETTPPPATFSMRITTGLFESFLLTLPQRIQTLIGEF
jgi:hypothetical protein